MSFEISEKWKVVLGKAVSAGVSTGVATFVATGSVLTEASVIGAIIGGIIGFLTYVKDNYPSARVKSWYSYL